MPVSDFECQIARGQIGRYLGGSTLSSEALRGLEEHIAECPGCKALVAERRAALLGQLDETPTHAVVAMPKKEEANPLVAALRARSEALETENLVPKAKAAPRYAGAKAPAAQSQPAKAPRTKPAAGKPALSKPLMLAAVLAGVLVAMSYLSRAVNGQGALGAKAATTFAADTIPSKPTPTPSPKAESAMPVATPDPAPVRADAVAQTTKPESEPVEAIKPEVKPTAIEKPVAKPPAPAAVETKQEVEASKVVAPKPVDKPAKVRVKAAVRRPIVRRKAVRHRVVAHAPRHAAKPRSGVRVYGPDGRPL